MEPMQANASKCKPMKPMTSMETYANLCKPMKQPKSLQTNETNANQRHLLSGPKGGGRAAGGWWTGRHKYNIYMNCQLHLIVFVMHVRCSILRLECIHGYAGTPSTL